MDNNTKGLFALLDTFGLLHEVKELTRTCEANTTTSILFYVL